MNARAFLRKDGGAAAVEFAITAPIFFLFLFGLLQAGLWLFAYFSLQRAVDAAARCAVVQTSTCGNAANTQTYAVNATVGLSVPPSAFTVTSPTCGTKVAASYVVPNFTSGFGLPTLTVNVSACYPI